MHVATAEDLERLDSITLEDLNERLQNLKFDHAGDRPTESEFDADLHLFVEAVAGGPLRRNHAELIRKEPKPQKSDAGPEGPRGETNWIKPNAGSAEKAREAGSRDTRQEEENTIRARRARIRSAPGAGAKPNSSEAPESAPPIYSRAVPEHINTRYIQVGNQYHFTNGDLAFKDRGSRLSTRLENTEVIRDLVAIAKEREWNDIALSGTERFRREAWREAELAGLSVRGYRPSELERAQLARLIAREREAGREPSLRPSAAPSERATTRPTATEDTTPPPAPLSAGAGSRTRSADCLTMDLPISSARCPGRSLVLRQDRYTGW